MMMLDEWLKFTAREKNALVMSYSYDAGLRENEAVMLLDNEKLLDEFFIEAHKIAKVRTSYSAYTIVEVLRHNNIVKDNSQNVFKIANETKPALARISTAMFPELNGLFKFKKREIIL
jgi:hypothetical protein